MLGSDMVGKETESTREAAKRALKYEAAPSDNTLITSSIRKKKRGEHDLAIPGLHVPSERFRDLAE